MSHDYANDPLMVPALMDGDSVLVYASRVKRSFNKNLIGISGKIKSGKDTVCGIIDNQLLYRRKFAGKLKEIAGLMIGVPSDYFENQRYKDQYLEEWGMTVREFLIRLGTDAVRDNLHRDAWVLSAFANWHPHQKAIFTDTRFLNECQGIINRGGVIIRVERDDELRGIVINHPSETELDGRTDLFDFVIVNNYSMDQLRRATEFVMFQIEQ